jgi:mRNA-degrading endonuclease RelE of RelBE toxin-antitoxin system
MYEVRFAEGVADDLEALSGRERSEILDRIEVQLRHEPTRPSRNPKPLAGLVPPWEHVEPVWELRIGEYRVFYDVDEGEHTVIVRAVRHKPSEKRTEEIL